MLCINFKVQPRARMRLLRMAPALVAIVAGTLFSAPAFAAADGTNSTLTVNSNNVNVGDPINATLTLKDAGNVALTDVSGTTATITSDNPACTVGMVTRSGTNGTVTTTITTNSAGTCTIGGTLEDGTTAITQTQVVMVTAAGPDANQSTVAVVSGTLNGVGATTTATLSLKDSGGTPLGDVSASMATVTTSNVGVCTVTNVVRSAVNGTVTATITAASAGTCNVGGTLLDGATPVTQTQAVTVTAVATAANSTLAVGSNTLNGVGTTTTATLTLKDASNAVLADVSTSGATITSSSGSCTVGAITRSTTNGTVTATITAASAGSCTIGGTLDGTTAVTATQLVTVNAVATAANSTLAVGSNSLSVGGSTTATLTLKDASNASLGNVMSTGATITSSSASCTVGTMTRSSFNGTVTATITAASAGSCTIGGTLNGTTAVNATQTITVASAAPAPVTITSPTTVTVGSGTTVNATTGSAVGGTVTLPGNTSNVTVNLGGSSSVGISSGSNGATVVVNAGSGSSGGNGLFVTQGSATITSNQSGQVLLSAGGSNVITSTGSQPVSINVSVGSNSSTTVKVNSGVVTAPRNCGTRPTAPASPPPGSKSSVWSAYFANVSTYQRALLSYSLCISDVDFDGPRVAIQAAPSTMLLYRGESVTYDANGTVVATSLVDGFAGDPQYLTLPSGFSLERVPVSIDGYPARLGGSALGSSVLNALQTLLGTAPTRLSNSSIGGIVTSLTDGTRIVGVPVGDLEVAPRDRSELQSNGQARIVTQGVAVNLAPTLVNPNALMSKLKGLDPQASVTVLANGVFKATIGGAQYFVRPNWTATPSAANGFSTDASGNLVFGDGTVQQTLYPGFADPNKVIAVLNTVAGVSSPVQAADGTISVVVGDKTFTLRPSYNLISHPLDENNVVLWWVDGGTYYVNYLDGTAQSFTLR